MKYFIILFFSSFATFAQLEKVEPPFWWSDMNLSSVQIMFYGKNIAQYDVKVSNDIKIENIKKTENPNYLFVTIDTKKILPQNFTFSFHKDNKFVFPLTYEIKKRTPNSKFRKSYDSSDLIYLVMPDRFANGNPNNDNDATTSEKADRKTPGGRHGGDIQGMIDHIDYLKILA